MKRTKTAVATALALIYTAVCSINLSAHEQKIDLAYQAKNTKVTFSGKKRPIVLVDEAHHNFHTRDGRYNPFAITLSSDGYEVRKNQQKFSLEGLKDADILVIANALNEKNADSWDLPNYSAFTRAEIEAVYHWVKQGGSLFLIADHMPFPKAAESLAAMFGFQFNNGYARFKVEQHSRIVFTRAEDTLKAHPILNGMSSDEKVDSVRTYTGQAFLPPPNARSLFTFSKGMVSLMPSKSWHLNADTPEISIAGWSQGATLKFAQGRVAVFGEAAMFTSQLIGTGNKATDYWIGLKDDNAPQNEQFLLNLMHWLSAKI